LSINREQVPIFGGNEFSNCIHDTCLIGKRPSKIFYGQGPCQQCRPKGRRLCGSLSSSVLKLSAFVALWLCAFLHVPVVLWLLGGLAESRAAGQRRTGCTAFTVNIPHRRLPFAMRECVNRELEGEPSIPTSPIKAPHRPTVDSLRRQYKIRATYSTKTGRGNVQYYSALL
jgi:hypothetical protein